MNSHENTTNLEKSSIPLNPLEHIMDVEEAAKLWNLQPSYVKDLCRLKLVKRGTAIKKGKTWILAKNQPNPGQPKHPNNWRTKNK